MSPETEKTEGRSEPKPTEPKNPCGYRKPRMVQVGTLRDVRAKGGRDGDHDTGYYFGRFRQ